MDQVHAVDARALALAARQDGLLTAAQADACGLTDNQREHRMTTGRFVVLTPGVYRVAGSPDSARQRIRAAVLALGAVGGVASHLSAASLHGLLAPSPLPHVTVPPGRSARMPLAKVHRSPVAAPDRCSVDGIPATAPARTIVDLAAVLDRPGLEAVVDDALCRGQVSTAALLAALERVGRGRRGRVLLRSVLEVWSERIEPGSPAEVRLLRRLAEWGIEPPVTQHEIRTPEGTFVARVDTAWPHRRLALEYEGVRHHAARAVERDERRLAALRALGWTVLTADKTDLLPGRRALAERLARLLAA